MKLFSNFIFIFILILSSTGHAARFIFVGDTGHGDAGQYSVAAGMKKSCGQKPCAFALLLGDNFYPNGVSSTTDPQWKTAFRDPYAPLGISFYPALGNHDYDGNEEAQITYSQIDKSWVLPARYHSFVKDKSEIFVMDTNQWNKTQADWLWAGLKKSRADWKIVIGHHPIYSYGFHGNTDSLIKGLRPILLGKADFYLSGHDHDKQILRDPTDSSLHYVVSGAGSETRPSSGGSLSLFNAATLGFSSLSLKKKSATLEMLTQDGKIEFIQTFKRRPVRKPVARSISTR